MSATGGGVCPTDTILVGATIAPYIGLLTDFDYDNNTHQFEYVPKHGVRRDAAQLRRSCRGESYEGDQTWQGNYG
ncbi:hypothetical protein GQ600_18591 [Phytophthora cactorum]|nr:hypothetical protein GQ600_18591 [Phytophthora cactorum]